MIKKKENKEYIFMWSGIPTLASYLGTPYALVERNDIYSGGGSIFSYYDGKIITTYMPKEDLEIRRNKESKIYLNQNYFKRYQKQYKKELIQWWNWVRKIEEKDYSKISNSQLKKDILQFQKYTTDSIAYFGSTRPEYTYQAEQRLEKILKKYFKERWGNVFGILVDAIELDDVQKEHLERLKLVNSGITNKKIKTHLSKFPWLVGDYLEEEKALDFIGKIFKKEKGNYERERDRFKKDKEELRSKQEEIYKQLNKENEKEARYLAGFLQKQSVERMNIKAYWIGCYYLARNMWLKIVEVLDISVNDVLKFITLFEIADILDDSYKGNIHKIIELRKKSYAVNFEKGQKKPEILNYKEADKLFEQKIKKPSLEDGIIKGQTASLGVYKGKVRKVIAGDLEALKDSINNFKKGEVLVTSMTQPNMMVIARRAGAIVADEGGITSHAAIISRELKIPCIVGCLKSMQVLNDGDLIEVNADKGVVKIIK